MNSKITNKDAKIIYAKYWYKNLNTEMFPTIYIDDYWEYTIDLFNLRNDWEIFLGTFKKEFDSAKQYIEKSNKITNELTKKLFIPDAIDKVNSFIPPKANFVQKNFYDLPDGDYWGIDLHMAFNQVMNYIGVLNKDVTYESIVNSMTDSTLLKSSKFLRINFYNGLDIKKNGILFAVYDTLLYKAIQGINTIKFEDIIGIGGDCIHILKNKSRLKEGDYIFNDVSIHIDSHIVKSIHYKDNIVKYLDTGTITKFFYKPNCSISFDDYLCIMKVIKNQQPNQIDLTVGYEDQIFYTLD